MASSELTKEQILEYHERGFLGPFDLLSAAQAKEYRKRIRREILSSEPDIENADALQRRQFRHRDCESVYELCTKEKIVEQMTDIYGQNLLLWESMLWYKSPGSAEIPWHQHYHHLPLEPKISITAWIALSPCTIENGCLQLIPGSQERPYPEVEAPDDVKFERMTDPEYVDESEAVTVEMEPGQYILFSEHTLHRSFENESENWREALAVRAVPPYVNIQPEKLTECETSSAMLLNGSDEYEINELVAPPTEKADGN